MRINLRTLSARAGRSAPTGGASQYANADCDGAIGPDGVVPSDQATAGVRARRRFRPEGAVFRGASETVENAGCSWMGKYARSARPAGSRKRRTEIDLPELREEQ
jgi:hypothetical protein